VTNYSKKHPIIYKVNPPGLPERVVNINSDYKTWLWKHRRSHFDPFRRRTRLRFTLDGKEYTTTVGQLNFMYWASRYGVLDYARTHLAEIENDHTTTTKSKIKKEEDETEGKRKRRQLSVPPQKKVFVYTNSVEMTFNPGKPVQK